MSTPEIEIAEFAGLGADAVVIDVRQPDEYEDGHVPGARLIPLADIGDRIDEIPTDQPVYVICQSGGRSLHASEFLIGAGIDATNVGGGTKAWIESGRDVVTGSRSRDQDG